MMFWLAMIAFGSSVGVIGAAIGDRWGYRRGLDDAKVIVDIILPAGNGVEKKDS